MLFFRRHWKWFVPLLLVLILCLTGAGTLWLLTARKVAVLQPGRVYRSGQMDAEDMRGVLERLRIRTVINLRGANPQSPWYANEVGLCEQLGVRHLDVSWSAKHLPQPGEVEKLIHMFREQPYPLLLHCQAGADRTGLASALYLIDQQKLSVEEAGKRSLNFLHGHLAIYPYFEMDEFLDLFSHKARGKSLLSWVNEDYPQIYNDEKNDSFWEEFTEPFIR